MKSTIEHNRRAQRERMEKTEKNIKGQLCSLLEYFQYLSIVIKALVDCRNNVYV